MARWRSCFHRARGVRAPSMMEGCGGNPPRHEKASTQCEWARSGFVCAAGGETSSRMGRGNLHYGHHCRVPSPSSSSDRDAFIDTSMPTTASTPKFSCFLAGFTAASHGQPIVGRCKEERVRRSPTRSRVRHSPYARDHLGRAVGKLSAGRIGLSSLLRECHLFQTHPDRSRITF